MTLQYAFSLSVNESSCCSISPLPFCAVNVWTFVILIGACWYLIGILTLISLMTYDVEHIFVYLSVIYVSSLARCLLRLLILFLKSVCFLQLSVKSLLCWIGQKVHLGFFHEIWWKNPSKLFSQPRTFRITVLYQTYLL